jgi:hypothetical protein
MKDQPKVGDVLFVAPDGSVSNGAITIWHVDKYPHLFRRLEWWEEWEISDLPDYIKELSTGKIGKVFEWHCIGDTTFFVIYPYSDLQKAKWFNPDFFAPATHKQYLDFIAPANLSA